MTFKDGNQSEVECPKCNDGTMMFYEMSFTDCFSYKTGHYTRDRPMLVCPKCEHSDDWEGDWE